MRGHRLRSLLLLTALLVPVGAGCGQSGPSFDGTLDHLDEAEVALVRDDDRRVEVVVKLAITDEEQRRGLMDVEVLADGTGMLFVFEAERQGGFWMKDTLVPLDIAFADAHGEVLAVLAMDPCEEDPCPVYDPEVAYRYALEVPQGWLAANGLGTGDHLDVATLQPS